MTMLGVAAMQMACSWELPANLDRAEKLIREYRNAWGAYRDRRPELYQAINTLDGSHQRA